MHTGINTGLVVARRSDARAGTYALTGDAVNTAARLRSLAAARRGARQRRHLAAGGRPLRGAKRARRSRSRARSGRSRRIASAASGRHRRRAPARSSAGTRSCATSPPWPRPAPSGSAAGSSSSAAIPGSASRGSSPSSRPTPRTLGFSCHAAAVLDFGAETGRDAIRSLARSLLGVAGTVEPEERRAAIERAAAARPIGPDRQLFLYDLLDVPPPPALRALAAAMSTAAREQRVAACHVRAGDDGSGVRAAAPDGRGHPLGRRLDARAPGRARPAGRQAAAAAGHDDALRRRPDGRAPGAPCSMARR